MHYFKTFQEKETFMKKFSMLFIALCLFVGFSSNNVFAKAIGLKGGYTWPTDDFKNYENTWAFGIYFDMGTFLINNLDFRPSFDYIKLENESRKHGPYGEHEVYGIHLDWYWHFLDKGTFSPFIGFGPSLNYLDWDSNDEDETTLSSQEEDSDAGVDLFLGADIALSGTPLTLMIEGRYKFFDIASREDTALQANLGVAYNF